MLESLARWLALACIYAIGARLGYLFTSVHPVVSPAWPPTGIAIAATLLYGRRVWPGVWIGALAANLWVGAGAAASIAIACGNTAEALVAATLVRAFAREPISFGRVRDVVVFVGFGALLAPVVGATVGPLALYLSGALPLDDVWSATWTWWLGDVGGALVVAPVLLAWSPGAPNGRSLLVGFLATLVAIGVFAQPQSVSFLLFPFTAWVAIRHGTRGATLAVLATAVVALAGTATVLARDDALLLSGMVCTLSVTALLLAASTRERIASEHALAASRSELQRLNAELEDRVRERTRELQTFNRELETFSYSVSHDLRAPLRAIDGFTHALAEEQALTQTGHAYVARVRAAVRRMSLLIDGLLDLSRMSRVALAHAVVDPIEFARGIAAELQARDPTRIAVFSFEGSETVLADPTLLRIALTNLLENAWKFTSHRAVAHIGVRATRRDAQVRVEVTDDGAGFDMEHAARLFRPFERLHAITEFEGTGIGLATVRRIAERHGGEVRAEGAVGRGARFQIHLPAAPGAGAGNHSPMATEAQR